MGETEKDEVPNCERKENLCFSKLEIVRNGMGLIWGRNRSDKECK